MNRLVMWFGMMMDRVGIVNDVFRTVICWFRMMGFLVNRFQI